MILNGVDFKKLVFANNEQNTFEKYAHIKGVYLHKQIYDVLMTYNTEQVSYHELSSVIRYDKNLRDKLYIYLATFEESLRTKLYSKYDVETTKTIYRGIQGLSKLKSDIKEKIDINFSNLYYCFELELGPTIELFEHLKIYSVNEIPELKQVKYLRNFVMHHNILVLGKSANKKDAEENLTVLRKQISLLCKYLPQEYQKGFTNDINNLNINFRTRQPYLDKLCLGEIQWNI